MKCKISALSSHLIVEIEVATAAVKQGGAVDGIDNDIVVDAIYDALRESGFHTRNITVAESEE